jgi:hypothetical protein
VSASLVLIVLNNVQDPADSAPGLHHHPGREGPALEPDRVRDVFTTSKDHCTDLQDKTGERAFVQIQIQIW